MRIRARKLSNGKVEFALQVGADRQWLPRARYFPYHTATVGRWLYASWYTVGDTTTPLDSAPPPRTTTTPPTDRSSCTFERTMSVILPAVFQVVVTTRSGTSTGTAFYVGNNEFLTAAHVVEGARTIRLQNHTGTLRHVEVAGVDSPSDVAILRADGSGVPAMRFGDESALGPGARIAAVGYPGAAYHPDSGGAASIVSGLLSSKWRDADHDYVLYIQTDAAANPGNSGGPVIDRCGEVAGLVVSKIVDEGVEGVVYAVTEATVREAMSRIRLADDRPAARDRSLGVVRIAPGQAIQIRSLNAVSGDVALFGLPIERSVMLAIEDYGPIRGFDVDMGVGLDDRCSYRGGEAGAKAVVADNDVLGVVGTSCSGAAAAAAPLLTAAGMVLISGGNTSPALTSDLAGNAGPNYSVGYYRTAHNDLFQGVAMALFVYNELGIDTAAGIHDGDPYTQGLAKAFTDAFAALGGTVTGFSAVNKEDTDMVPVLTEIAAGSPGALFFPIFQPAGDFIADQAPGVRGLEGTVLLATDGLLNTNYLSLPQTAGMYLSGPDTRFGDNVNQSTGKTANDFLAAYEANYGESPAAPFWAHGYDATAMLLDAIKAASYLDGQTLVVDRQGVRDYLNSLAGYSGLTGNINCDDFGDCGSSRITVVRNIGGPANALASLDNVVFSFAP